MKKTEVKKIVNLFLVFWIPSALVIFLDVVYGSNSNVMTEGYKQGINFISILINNVCVCLLLIFLGKIHKYLVYGLYIYNAFLFSIYLFLALENQKLIFLISKLSFYGIFEVLALAIAVFIGINQKNELLKNKKKYYVACVILLILAAFCESLILIKR